jgi:hypothetical protein
LPSAPDGSVTNLKWLDGTKQNVLLNAPKGLAIQGNLLYVADINRSSVVLTFLLAAVDELAAQNKANRIVPKITFLDVKFMSISILFYKKVNTTDDRIVVANVGFKTPESIEYYPAEDVYLVSNINGDYLEWQDLLVHLRAHSALYHPAI